MFAHAVAGIGVAGHHHGAVDGLRGEETVDDLQGGEDTARTIGDVEGKCAVRAGVRILGIGADVLLDQRRECRFAQISVAVDSRVDQKVDVVRFSSRHPQAILRGVHREVQGAVPVTPPAPAHRDLFNHGAHSDSPSLRPMSA